MCDPVAKLLRSSELPRNHANLLRNRYVAVAKSLRSCCESVATYEAIANSLRRCCGTIAELLRKLCETETQPSCCEAFAELLRKNANLLRSRCEAVAKLPLQKRCETVVVHIEAVAKFRSFRETTCEATLSKQLRRVSQLRCAL